MAHVQYYRVATGGFIMAQALILSIQVRFVHGNVGVMDPVEDWFLENTVVRGIPIRPSSSVSQLHVVRPGQWCGNLMLWEDATRCILKAGHHCVLSTALCRTNQTHIIYPHVYTLITMPCIYGGFMLSYNMLSYNLYLHDPWKSATCLYQVLASSNHAGYLGHESTWQMPWMQANGWAEKQQN